MTKGIMRWLIENNLMFSYLESIINPNENNTEQKRADNARFLSAMKEIAAKEYPNDCQLMTAISRGLSAVAAA